MTAGAMKPIGVPPSRSILRLGTAFALGCISALSGIVFGMPGKGEFVVVIWVAAFVALLIAHGWPGFTALIAGATVSAAILDLSDGVFGLVFLIVAVVGVLAAQGALSASVLIRLREVGWSAGRRDGRVLLGAGLAIGGVLSFVWFATEFARNPP